MFFNPAFDRSCLMFVVFYFLLLPFGKMDEFAMIRLKFGL